uniref:Uncharacterized protein n=1 Tax=Amphimedon queenslandica TaxID=400682 RepID=A0A1X7VFW7_AMPQE
MPSFSYESVSIIYKSFKSSFYGGIGLGVPTLDLVASIYRILPLLVLPTTRKLTSSNVEALKGITEFDIDEFNVGYYLIQEEITKEKAARFAHLFSELLLLLTLDQQRAVNRAKGERMSSWLPVAPVAKNHFDLSAQEFKDLLALRYLKTLQGIPPTSDGCSATFDLSHAIICRCGGLVTHRHNEVRDCFGDLAAFAWSEVIRKPVVREARSHFPALVADIAVHGVWVHQGKALFNIRVIDTDAWCYRNQSPIDMLSGAEKEKKCLEACTDRGAVFTSLCSSVDRLLGREAHVFVNRIADRLSSNQNTNNAQGVGQYHRENVTLQSGLPPYHPFGA